jgi:SAM-dependent methyltransferase
MGDGADHDEARRLVPETQAIWDAKATFWDARMGDGNTFQRVLVGPAVERLLAVRPGETVLDVACGNGVFARRLAALGARVVATDFSERFLELARARSADLGESIDYRLADATDEAQLLAFGEGRFDAVVCAMALMDMPTVEPLLRAARRLLVPGGRFVFAIPHPAFNSNATRLGIEEEDRAGELVETRSVRIAGYLGLPPGKGTGMAGEPVPHWYFHRPLGELLGACFAAGFVLDGLEEPAFGPEAAGPAALSWENFPGIPPVLVARLQPASSTA